MKTLAVLTVCLPIYIYAQQPQHSAQQTPKSQSSQAMAEPPEPTPKQTEMPDTTLVGTKKQQKEAKKKAEKEMKKKEKEVKDERIH
ncbi:hypothetical protein [Bdellovibrio sp. NC01]|uniref:hypothetical protein n=1 Tax=Bdellovibrio sp. NC01 TaxID=2220073 RepID=UPI00115B736F|nr:hypothetical protein [Bdellovibrio sp. NC01]QDK36765.1 hypothetical protein DOE51_03695 [Bdellovibrio sp. NC01]